MMVRAGVIVLVAVHLCGGCGPRPPFGSLAGRAFALESLAPAVGIKVRVYSEAGVLTRTTNRCGFFEVANIEAGTYRVVFDTNPGSIGRGVSVRQGALSMVSGVVGAGDETARRSLLDTFDRDLTALGYVPRCACENEMIPPGREIGDPEIVGAPTELPFDACKK